MTNERKEYLRREVKYLLSAKVSEKLIVDRMMSAGFKPVTIKKYIKAFKILPQNDKH